MRHHRPLAALLLSLPLLFIFPAAAHAQVDAQKPFDSFGDSVLETDWLARLDGLAVSMRERPETKAFIVAYGVPNKLPGWPLRRAHWARGVLTKGRGLDPSRVEVVYGGYRDEVSYEHWLMSGGERPPLKPFDFAAALTREKGAYKFDQFYLPDPDPASVAGYDGSYSRYLDNRGRYEALALALRHDPAARGLVMAYETPRRGARRARRLAANIKRAILGAHAVAPDRVIAVGALRRERGVEIWIVPPGAALPRPSRR